MGIYTRNTINERSNSIDIHRASIDFGEDYMRNVHIGNGIHVDLGRDSVIDPTDIATILRKKQKENKPVYR